MKRPRSSSRRTRPAQKARPAGKAAQVAPPASAVATLMQALPARVLHRDRELIILDKPAGLAVHPGPSGGLSLEAALDALRFEARTAPFLAHRLDRDTSGCLVLARRRSALRRLNALFAAGEIEKTYWAVVLGSPPADSGIVELALRKLNRKEGWKMVADPSGQSAVTHWRLLGQGDGMSWLECKPRTGRTHQVRVHCAALGCPILGDPVYGAPGKAPGGIETPLQLHARAVSIPSVEGAPPIAAAALVPAHMRAALTACGWRDESGASSRARSG
ncbi:RluA family pseudouridine synthase [Hypericibacter sp.]|uniref:RluA family pseudouridine synthase n=1 Tax=Hypericibacter sp. TaxID=2705401 RepID=UPI003D6D179C